MRNSKTLFITIGLLFISTLVFSQNLETFNQERLKMTSNGMLVLGTWALGNIAINPILQSRATGSKKYFYQMNTLWNTVNLGIAGFGYYNAVKGDPASFSFSQSLIEQGKIEKALLFNSGLDLAYISTGFYLRQRSKTSLNNPDRLLGFGHSLILQGAWLFAFDLSFYLIQNNHSGKLMNLVDGLAFTPNGVLFTMKF